MGEEPSLERQYSGISQGTVSKPDQEWLSQANPPHILPALLGANVETILPVVLGCTRSTGFSGSPCALGMLFRKSGFTLLLLRKLSFPKQMLGLHIPRGNCKPTVHFILLSSQRHDSLLKKSLHYRPQQGPTPCCTSSLTEASGQHSLPRTLKKN